MNDDRLRGWEESEDICDDLFKHFKESALSYWCDIADEGRRVWNVMWQEEVEEFSPIDAVISAVASQSSHGAYVVMARALGVDKEALELAVAPWMDCELTADKPEFPAQITPEELMLRISESKQWLEDLGAGRLMGL